MPAALDAPHHLQAPLLRVAGLVAQALERNPHLDLVAGFGQPPHGVEHEVGAQVRRLAPGGQSAEAAAGAAAETFHQRAVGLHAERVGREHERLPPVVERAEVDLHVVVGVDAVAIGQGGPDGARSRARADAEENRGGRVPDEHRGLVLRGPAVGRRVLGEAGEARGLLPDRLVEMAVHLDRRLEPGDVDLDLVEPAVVLGAGGGHGGAEPAGENEGGDPRGRVGAGRQAHRTAEG